MVEFEFDVDWPRAAWIAFGVVLTASLLYVFHWFVGTFVFGLFIYYATRRLYRRVSVHVDQPSIAAALSLLGLTLPGVLLLWYTLVVALRQLETLVEALNGTAENSPLGGLVGTASPYLQISTIIENPGALVSDAGGIETVTGTLNSLLGYLGVIGTGLLHLFVMFALAFYLLRDGPRLASWASGLTQERTVFEEYVIAIDESFDKVFYGNILNAIITGVIGAIVYSLLNFVAPTPVEIPYAMLVGLLAGGASLIPVVGMKLVYVPMTGYLAFSAAQTGDGWWFVVTFVGASFLLVDVIPDLMVRPYVSGGKLHTGALMFAYMFGPLIFGWYGIFLAPIVLVLVVHFVELVLPELLANEPIRAERVDPATIGGPDVTAQTEETPEPDEPGAQHI